VAWMGHHGVNLAAFAEGLTQMGAGATVYPNLERPDFASPVALAFLTAFVAAIWPAWQAARLRPAEALRHV